MLTYLFIWAALLATLVIVAIGRSGKGGALTLAYFLGLSLIHVPGILAFLDPNNGVPGRGETTLGTQITLMGMAAFTAGAVAAHYMGSARRRSRMPSSHDQPRLFGDLAWWAVGIGVVAYFILLPVAGKIPSLTSIVAALSTLLIVGLWMRLYDAVHGDKTWIILSTLSFLPVLPISTLATGGFVGFGVYWALSVLSFLFVISKRRIWFFVVSPVVILLGLSLFVTYMGQRVGIRYVIWTQRASFTDRLDRMSTMATEFKLLDLGRRADLDALNDRLNQSYLVGRGAMRHEEGAVELSYGGTVSPTALIPRAVWPDKPDVGGGGDLVSRFTGKVFAAGTSVGTGSVLEFYMNFGVPGVIFGFLGLGFGLIRLDQNIMRALVSGDVRKLFTNAMPGLALLQPGGNFLEIVVAFTAAQVASRLVLLLPIFHTRTAVAPEAQIDGPSPYRSVDHKVNGPIQ